MKVFVTGGTGFIGSHLIAYLLANKHAEVFALVRDLKNPRGLDISGIHLLEGDLFAIPPLPKDLDCIIHIAGITKSCQTADYYTVNQKGTASLLQSISAQEITVGKFIFISSLAAAGPSNDKGPVLESAPPAPVSSYGKSKMMAEMEILRFKESFPTVILRAAVIFGPADPGLLSFLKFIKKGFLPTPGFRSRPLSVCYITDLVRAIDLAIEKSLPCGGIFNIADPTPRTWEEFGRAAGKTLGVELKRIRIPMFLAFTLAFLSECKGKIKKSPEIFNRDKYAEMKQRGWIADTRKAEEQLHFVTQYAFDDAVKKTVEWYLEKGWL